MRSFAARYKAYDSSEEYQLKRDNSSYNKVVELSSVTTGGSVLQRKASCACGGGCPDCRSEGTKSSDLKVSRPGDAAEIEADHIADKVMRMPDAGSVETKANSPDAVLPMIQTKTSGGGGASDGTFVGGDISGRINSSRGGGSGLDTNTRSFMESRFGADLGSVRIHTGGEAAEMSRDLNAKAFTVGSDIYFKEGQYRPDSESGKHLLAHELTHVVQQRGQQSEIGSQIQRADDDAGTTTTAPAANAEVCQALRSQLENSGRVIALYRQFLAGGVTWEEMRSQLQTVGNAAVGVTAAGRELPQVVQEAIAEVETIDLEELRHAGRILWGLTGDAHFTHVQWVTNEIERQQHLNRVLVEAMYRHGCPDFPGTWQNYQEQVLSVGTRGSETPATGVGLPLETRTAVAWVRIGREEVLVLATEVAGAGRLRFVRWIDSAFRDITLRQAQETQGTIPAVPDTAVMGLPSSVPGTAARR